jgi:thymidylate synthase
MKKQESKETFKRILTELVTYGHNVAPRGLDVIELENFNYELAPYVRFMSFPARKLNINYIKEEFLWYLHGDRFDTSIANHAKMWKDIINLDGSINSNYGQYLFGTTKQFNNVYEILKRDKDSRRASVVILNKEHLLSETKDVPCTYALNFRIRGNRLNMSVHMRSQDAIFGMGNDAPAFSFIHEMMFNLLKEIYPKLEYGMYHHVVDSFHIYAKHYAMADAIFNSDDYDYVDCPKILNADEVRFLLDGKFDCIPNDYKFTQWLCQPHLL